MAPAGWPAAWDGSDGSSAGKPPRNAATPWTRPTPAGYSPVESSGAVQASGPPRSAATASASGSSSATVAATRAGQRTLLRWSATTTTTAAAATAPAGSAQRDNCTSRNR
jgi:hypothetical protein